MQRTKELVERRVRLPEAPDAVAIAERVTDRAAEDEPDILDEVMRVNIDVTAAVQRDIHAAVFRERLDHVAEEGQRQRDGTHTGAVDDHVRADLRLTRVAPSRRGPNCRHARSPKRIRARIAASCAWRPSAWASAMATGATVSKSVSVNCTKLGHRRKSITASGPR